MPVEHQRPGAAGRQKGGSEASLFWEKFWVLPAPHSDVAGSGLQGQVRNVDVVAVTPPWGITGPVKTLKFRVFFSSALAELLAGSPGQGGITALGISGN